MYNITITFWVNWKEGLRQVICTMSCTMFYSSGVCQRVSGKYRERDSTFSSHTCSFQYLHWINANPIPQNCFQVELPEKTLCCLRGEKILDMFHIRSRDQRNSAEMAPPSQGLFNSETACLLFMDFGLSLSAVSFYRLSPRREHRTRVMGQESGKHQAGYYHSIGHSVEI